MSQKQLLIRGTLILTISGFLTKIIGFVYRIFLSQAIGAQGMGIYQLIFPIHTLCFALSVGGIQTAISRFVAAKTALKEEQSARDIFLIAAFLSTSIALLSSFFLYRYADWFALHILLEKRCEPLLKLMAVSIPMGTFHSCVNGYFFAKKKMAVPAASQLLEQGARVAASWILFLVWKEKGISPTPLLAVFGMLGGELVSMLFSVLFLSWDFQKAQYQLRKLSAPVKNLKTVLLFSFPLTCNRIFVNVLHSVESILIPGHLRLFGLDAASALAVYGILTGMALPLILFPCAVTNAVSAVLLPSVAQEQAVGNRRNIQKSIYFSIKYSLLLGFLSTMFFFLSGDLLGLLLFKNEFAGTFIKTLSFICPCLYLTSTLGGILNGLGAANQMFFLNLVGLGIRLGFVWFVIPVYGIPGYLWGLIVSELAVSLFSIYFLKKWLFID